MNLTRDHLTQKEKEKYIILKKLIILIALETAIFLSRDNFRIF